MMPESHAKRDNSEVLLSLLETSESFVLEDVTDNPRSLAWAFDLVVQGYLALSSQELDPGEVRQEVCYDVYHQNGLARTVVLTGRHPETGEREALATMRVTTATSRARALGLPPLESMELMAPAEGWENFHFAGFDADQVAEGGRLAVSPTCRMGRTRETGLTGLVLHALVHGAFELAAEHYGKTQLWGILPYYVVERFESIGMRVLPAHEVICRVKENDRMFKRYDRYWFRARPAFCKVILPT
jgi:hypothetical protein